MRRCSTVIQERKAPSGFTPYPSGISGRSTRGILMSDLVERRCGESPRNPTVADLHFDGVRFHVWWRRDIGHSDAGLEHWTQVA